jgi:hypothetical protein
LVGQVCSSCCRRVAHPHNSAAGQSKSARERLAEIGEIFMRAPLKPSVFNELELSKRKVSGRRLILSLFFITVERRDQAVSLEIVLLWTL